MINEIFVESNQKGNDAHISSRQKQNQLDELAHFFSTNGQVTEMYPEENLNQDSDSDLLAEFCNGIVILCGRKLSFVQISQKRRINLNNSEPEKK